VDLGNDVEGGDGDGDEAGNKKAEHGKRTRGSKGDKTTYRK
jgi:hypothetical protein